MVLATLNELRSEGVDARLTVVGKMPRYLRQTPGVTFVGFLDKNSQRDVRRLTALYLDAHLFLLPSLGDCTPMVVAEAMAHGTPVLASDVGGIRSLFGTGCGEILPSFATPGDWARSVRALACSQQVFNDSSRAAFAHARQNLTWASWARQVEFHCHQALSRQKVVKIARITPPPLESVTA